METLGPSVTVWSPYTNYLPTSTNISFVQYIISVVSLFTECCNVSTWPFIFCNVYLNSQACQYLYYILELLLHCILRIGRHVRATITLYPIGRHVRATITLYPIGRHVRASITLYPIGTLQSYYTL